jgi:pectate lyase
LTARHKASSFLDVPIAAVLAALLTAALVPVGAGPATLLPVGAGPATLLPVGAGPAAASADGWASLNGGTTGGAGAAPESVFVVHDRAELIAALANGGNPGTAKVVVVDGVIHGNEAADGTLLGEQDYAPGYDLSQYMQCFVGGTVWSDSAFPFCKPIRTLRQNGSNAEKKQIQITVPSNTTLVGAGRDAKLDGVDLTVNVGTNIVIRNLTLVSPIDYFTSWDPGDGAEGSWNARFDAMSVVTGTNLWVDHCTFTDGQYPDSEAPVGFHDRPVQRHDGLLDIEDGSDFITVSYSQFLDHDKTLLIGSGDGKGDRDRGHLRLTFHNNLFRNAQERSPRLRFGEVHTYNNYFVGSLHDPDYPMVSQALGGAGYFLGMGLESKIFSEFNAFQYDARVQPEDIAVANLKGNQFVDRGSWVNGRHADITAVAKRKFDAASALALATAAAAGTEPEAWATGQFTTDVGFDPADLYAYRPLTSPNAVITDVLRHSGAGAG